MLNTSIWKFILKLYHSVNKYWAGEEDVVVRFSAFQPQGPQFDHQLCRDLKICTTFFSPYAYSTFHPYRS